MSPEAAGFTRILRVSARLGRCACLLAVPFHLVLQRSGAADPQAGIRIPCVDLAIWATCALVLAEGLACGELPRQARALFVSAPASCAFAVAVGLSAIVHHGGVVPPADLVQTIDYYVLWPWIMVTSLGDEPGRRRLREGATLSVLLLLAAALVQVGREVPSHLVRGLFADHRSYVVGMMVLLPIVWTLSAATSGWSRWLGHAVAMLVLSSLGSLAAIAIVTLQLIVAAILATRRWSSGIVPAACATVAVAVLSLRSEEGSPRDSPLSLLVSQSRRRMHVLEAKRAYQVTHRLVSLPVAGDVQVSSNLTAWADEPERIAPADDERDPQVLNEYYAESWSAAGLVAESPFLGHGIGSWQRVIGSGYGTTERTGTAFPNTSNGYLLVAVETGLFGLACFAALLWKQVSRLSRMIRDERERERRALSAACLVGVGAGAVAMLAYPLAFQPMAVYWLTAGGLAPLADRGTIRE